MLFSSDVSEQRVHHIEYANEMMVHLFNVVINIINNVRAR